MKVKRNAFRVVIVLMCFVIGVGLLSSCGKAKESETQQANSEIMVEETPDVDVTENKSLPEEAKKPVNKITKREEISKNEEVTVSEEIQLFEETSKKLAFSSGAGAWSTLITLNSDGSFEGIYHDSEMGISGEGYPHGSVYICAFSGQFDDIKQVNDYTYSMTLSEITTQDNEGEEWIKDQIRYIASVPYGMEDGEEFLLYNPETPIKELPENFLSWWPKRYLSEEEVEEILSCYGLYNKEMGYGFFTNE